MGDMTDLTLSAAKHNVYGMVSLPTLVRIGDNGVRFAAGRAVNNSLNHMRSLISQMLRDTYYIKKEKLDTSIKIHDARFNSNPTGKLTFKDFESPPLSKFSPVQNKKRTFISVKVLKTNRRRRIEPGGEKRIIATSKGRAAVWLAKGQIMARTEDSAHPVVLYGPSFMAFFRRENVIKALNIEARDWFLKRFRHELRYELRKVGFK